CHWPHAGLDCKLQGSDGGTHSHLPAAPDIYWPEAEQLRGAQGSEVGNFFFIPRPPPRPRFSTGVEDGGGRGRGRQDKRMNIHEYQARQLLAQSGVAIPPGEACDTPEAARAIAEKLFADGAKLVVVKSMIHSGGRGKGTFKNGFKGGVKLCKSASEVFEMAK